MKARSVLYRVDVFTAGEEEPLHQETFEAHGDEEAFDTAGNLIKDLLTAAPGRYAEVLADRGAGFAAIAHPMFTEAEPGPGAA